MPDESARKPLFEVVGAVDEDAMLAALPKPTRDVAMLKLGLTALSQRAVAAVADLFTLVTVGSAFWLCMSIQNPNTYQLVEIGMYAMFVLAANWIVRRK